MNRYLGRLRCRLFAVSVLGAGFGLWLAHGARLGFWVTSVERRVLDPDLLAAGVELETIVWEDRFLTGIETPFLTLALALSLWSLSFVFPDSRT